MHFCMIPVRSIQSTGSVLNKKGTYRLNWHARAVKGKRKQYVLSLMAFILCSKDRLCQTKGMADVQMAIGIGVREGDNEFLVSGSGRIWFKRLFLLPHFLYGNLIRTKCIALARSFADVQFCHGGRGRRSHFWQLCMDYTCYDSSHLCIQTLVYQFYQCRSMIFIILCMGSKPSQRPPPRTY